MAETYIPYEKVDKYTMKVTSTASDNKTIKGLKDLKSDLNQDIVRKQTEITDLQNEIKDIDKQIAEAVKLGIAEKMGSNMYD